MLVDNTNQAMMEGGRIQMCSEAGHEHGKFAVGVGHSAYPHGRISKFSHILEMGYKGDVDMTEDHSMDCSENNNMDVSISRAKLTSENLRLKQQLDKVEVGIPMINQNMALENDIDKRRASKKVFKVEEIKEESIPIQDHLMGFLHKKRPQKRAMSLTEDEQNFSCTLNPIILKDTSDLIRKIKKGTASTLTACFSYSPRFSDISKLEAMPEEKITSGTFGVVVKVRDTQTREILIQKKVKKNAAGRFEVKRNEIEIPLQFPDAENIAAFLGLTWNGQELTFIMEDAGKSLRQLNMHPKFRAFLVQPKKIEKIMLDMYTGISHLANHAITHCDIKPENICLNINTWVAKLVDFGSSKTSQNVTDYVGITPEYLDPLANKSLYEFMVMKSRNPKMNAKDPELDGKFHMLDEKDDVYSAGLVGLFLIMGVHPMIQHLNNGTPEYQGDVTSARLNVMKKIRELNEESMQNLLDRPMSNIMKTLFNGTLALNRNLRWTSKMAVYFLQNELRMELQPPNKLSKQEPQSYNTQNFENQSKFVDLNKDIGIEVTQKRQQESPVYQCAETEQRFGIAFKEPPVSAQYGGILMPAKFQSPTQKGLMVPASNIARPLGTPSQQEIGHQLNLRPKLQRNFPEIPLEVQETKDYNDLVESFNVKLIPSMSRQNPLAQVAQRFGNVPQQEQSAHYATQPFSPREKQRVLPPNVDTGQMHVYRGFAQEEQLTPNSNVMHGFSGRLFKVSEEGVVGTAPTLRACENIPDIDALIQSAEEQARPKIKGVRRNRASQD